MSCMTQALSNIHVSPLFVLLGLSIGAHFLGFSKQQIASSALAALLVAFIVKQYRFGLIRKNAPGEKFYGDTPNPVVAQENLITGMTGVSSHPTLQQLRDFQRDRRVIKTAANFLDTSSWNEQASPMRTRELFQVRGLGKDRLVDPNVGLSDGPKP